MSTPVVIQGTPVSNPNTQGGGGFKPSNNGNNQVQVSPIESKKESGCNDIFFFILFYINIFAIVAVAVTYGPHALQQSASSGSSSSTNIYYKGYVTAVVIIAVISLVLSGLGMAVLMCIPETLIKVALIFTVIMSGLSMVFSFLSGQVGLGILGVIFFLLTLCYAWVVWKRIPFAAINLVVATTAVKKNLGVTVYAYLLTILGAAWSIVWSVAFAGVFDKTYQCDAQNVCTSPNYGYLFLLFIAYFFGQQVFQYSIHVITAGTVGTWWYDPDECGCCSSAIHNAFFRTITTSFGSICFGSLVVAIIQALRMLANSAQANGDASWLACIAECILACLASIVEYLNKWAFVYVGIYGFPYIKSAKSVFQLFANRGWDAIVADQLVADTLFLVSIVVGAIMGAVALIIQASTGVLTQGNGHQQNNVNVMAFFLGFIVGLTLCSILMSVIGSGVNAVIVLFAEAPAEFQQNYPDLSNRMRSAWSSVYPGSI